MFMNPVTFKLITAAAAIEKKAVGVEEVFDAYNGMMQMMIIQSVRPSDG